MFIYHILKIPCRSNSTRDFSSLILKLNTMEIETKNLYRSYVKLESILSER